MTPERWPARTLGCRPSHLVDAGASPPRTRMHDHVAEDVRNADGCNRAPPALPRRLLLGPNAVPAAPLRPWAASLAVQLKEARRKPRDASTLGEISVALNQAALVAYWRGEPGDAQAICNRHIAWLTDASSSPIEALFFSLQPFVNLGRIAAGCGDGPEAKRASARPRG